MHSYFSNFSCFEFKQEAGFHVLFSHSCIGISFGGGV